MAAPRPRFWNVSCAHQNLWVETPPFMAAFRVAVLVFDIFNPLNILSA